MIRVLKALAQFIFLAVPLLLLAAGAAVLWMSRSLPAGNGAVEIGALSAPVTISRDERGVPHIVGQTRADVLAGLGFAHAQDRLWQMELLRMAAQGRLSELFGETTLKTDIWLRSLGLADAAAASYDLFPPEARELLESYVSGVNSWIGLEGRSFSSKWPPEFVILRHEPEPWEPLHALVVMKMMSITLGENSSFERLRLAFARLGMTSAEIEDLLPLVEGDDAPELPDLTELLGLDKGRLNVQAADTAHYPLLEDVLVARSSNNWVISGDRTATGKPILANDPHLDLTAPSVWYLAHLRIDGPDGNATNMVGVSQPGVPLILLGRNDNVAWGFTNTRSDVQDIFVEKVNPESDQQYLTPDGWKPFETKEEIIRISGGEEHRFTRRRTRHGPVLPSDYANLDVYLPKGTVAALQWVALADDDLTMLAGFGSWDLETVQEFQNGMVDYVTPMQSMVVADTSGNIGMIAPGRVPLRDPQNLVMGRAPVPGWDPVYDWKGTIPFQGLPRSLNPPVGAIATANTRMVGPSYPFFLTFDWDEPWRQDRIDALIVDNATTQTMEISRNVQADVHSLAFAALVPKMVALVEGRDDVDDDAIRRLKSWNYDMTLDGSEPLIIMAWLRQAMDLIYSDDLGPAFDPWFKARAMPLERLFDGKTARDWCDDRSTPPKDSCADMLVESLDNAISLLNNLYGTDREKWSWGRAHPAAGKHTPFSDIPVLKSFFDVRVPNVGGQFTVDRGVTDFTDTKAPFVNTDGASFRALYDLSNLDDSTYVITTGQSGNPFSKHYRDMAQPWADVESFTIPTDPSVFDGAVVGVWRLSPTGQ